MPHGAVRGPGRRVLRRPDRLPLTLGVRVMLVDSLGPGTRRLWRMRQLDSHALVHDGVSWQRVIHEQDGDAGVLARDPGVHRLMHAVDDQPLVAKLVQQLERAIGRLGDAMQIEQAKSPVKWHGRKIVLFKNIREGPEAVPLDQTARLQRRLCDKGRGVRFVVPRISRIGRGIPFGVVDGAPAGTTPRVLRPFAKDPALTMSQLRLGIIVGMTERVGGIMMSAHEIDRHLGRCAELEKFLNPSIARRRRSADLE